MAAVRRLSALIEGHGGDSPQTAPTSRPMAKIVALGTRHVKRNTAGDDPLPLSDGTGTYGKF
jgi:hypothetical protein